MDETSIQRWNAYREAIEGFYPPAAGDRDGNGDWIDADRLQGVVDASDELTDQLVAELPAGTELESTFAELETAILATAALDAAIAADVLNALRDEAYGLASDFAVPDAVLSEVPWRDGLEPIGRLVARANVAFGQLPEVAGGAPDHSSPMAQTNAAIDALLHRGTPVAISFGKGLFTGTFGTLIGVLGHAPSFGALADHLANRGGARLPKALRLLANVVRKLVALVKDHVTDVAIDLDLDGVVEAHVPIDRFGTDVVRRVTRADAARRKVAAAVERHQLRPNSEDMLNAELVGLCRRFEKNMHSSAVIARGVKLCAPGVILIAGPPGEAALCAVYGTGLTYTLFSLADRLDSIRGWVHGAPTILRHHLEPLPPATQPEPLPPATEPESPAHPKRYRF